MGEDRRGQASAGNVRAGESALAVTPRSERIGQIFTLAGEQAQARKDRAAQEIATLRSQAQKEADTSRAAAISQTEQMLAAAQQGGR
jgi:hypothetical protein